MKHYWWIMLKKWLSSNKLYVFNVMFKENLRYKLNKLHNPKYKQPNHCLFNEVDLVTINIHLSKIIATDVFLMHQTT
jgi:hypothetical protein